MNLTNSMEEFGLETYLSHGEWAMVGTSVTREDRVYTYYSDEHFPEIYFTVQLQVMHYALISRLQKINSHYIKCCKVDNLSCAVGLWEYEDFDFGMSFTQKIKRKQNILSGRSFFLLQRKYTFYFMYILLPCIMLSFVLLMIFLLPAESGEKVSLGVSILVSFSLFLIIVAEQVPDTSDAIPVMGK